ncbi:MAG TPA: hypothetical protein VL225_13965 [Vicinamibacterales bacterium]|nr:hypothetical protein [Vicinamibacterales bacterium]
MGELMGRRLVETLRGIGAVHADERLLRVARYELSVWSEDQGRPTDADPTSGASIDGHIDITGIAEAAVLTGPDSLTLTLEDGRRLVFRLTSSGGRILGRFVP